MKNVMLYFLFLLLNFDNEANLCSETKRAGLARIQDSRLRSNSLFVFAETSARIQQVVETLQNQKKAIRKIFLPISFNLI